MFRPPTKYSEYLQDVRKSIDYILKRVNATTVTKIVAGTNVTISPADGTGVVTINSTGGGGGGLPVGGTAGQILSKIDSTNYNAEWIDNYALWTSTLKHEVKAGQAINKGQAVYVSSADGTNMIVSKASNTTEVTSSKTMGLLAQNLAVNGKGFVITEGLLAGLDTSAANAAGDPVWLGADGNLLFGIANKPYAPLHMVSIGVVTRKNSSNGEIFVKVQNGFELDELHNVDARFPNNNDGIFYNSTTMLWEHKPVSDVYATPTLAQVTTAGNTTANSIVIGSSSAITASPYTLQVVGGAGGSAIFSNSAKTQGLNINLTTAGETRIYGDYFGAGVDQKLILGTFANRATQLVLQTSGNISIGTTTDAGYKLDVNGTARVKTNDTSTPLLVNHSGSVGIQIEANSNGYRLRLASSSTNADITTPDGYLAINSNAKRTIIGASSSPSAILQVAGSITAASALARGVYFNNTLVQAAASDVLTAFQVTPTFTVDPTLLHNAYWMRFTGAYSPAAYNNPNNNATTIDLSNSFTNTFNAVGLRIRHTYSNVQNGYGILLESAGFIGIAQTSTTAQNYFAGITSIGSTDTNANPATLNVINGTNGGIKVGNLAGNSEHLIISHSQAGATSSSIRNTYNSTSAVMLIDVAAQGNLRLFGTGNVTVGSATDAGYKLDVNGTVRSQGKLTISTGGTEITGTIVGYSGLQVYGTTQIFSGNAFQIFNAANNSKASFQYINALGLALTTNVDAVSGVLRGLTLNSTLVAAANNDVLVGLDINPTFTNGAFTGVQNMSLRVNSQDNAVAARFVSTSGSLYIVPRLSSLYGTYIGTHNSTQTAQIPLSLSANKFIFDNGNVLIGTTTDAGYKLDVNGTSRFSDTLLATANASTHLGLIVQPNSQGNAVFRYLRTAITNFATFEFANGSVSSSVAKWGIGLRETSDNDFHFYNHTASKDQLVIKDNTGYVGIGTSSPSYPLHISSSAAANIYGTVQSTSANGTAAWVAFNDQSDNVVYRVFGSGASGTQLGQSLARSASLMANLGGTGKFLLGTYSSTDFVMGTGDQERMRIVASTGNVLIGTTTDAGYKLNVGGDINASGHVIAQTNLKSLYQSGDEGGEIFLNAPATNTTIPTGVTIDVYQNRLRFFCQGGAANGYYLDMPSGGAGVGTNLSPAGFTGTFTVLANPVGQRNLNITNGIVISVT